MMCCGLLFPGTVYRVYFNSCGGALPTEPHRPPQMRISLPRHDLRGEERWLISQRRRARNLFSVGFIGFNLHRNARSICKAESLSGGKDQTIDNIQRTMRAYLESGSDS